MISVSNLSFSFGTKPVFDGVSFTVGKGQKVGLIGPNGAGKSTLFKLILGLEDQSEGTVEVNGKISFVPQEIKRDETMDGCKTAREYLDPEGVYQDFELLRILAGLEYSTLSLDSGLGNLSGGQKTKLALARALLSNSDILILDEPTNFLDIAGKRWVMSFLGKTTGTVLIVSHDIALLDKHIDQVLEVTPHNGKIEKYKGNYSKYLELKAEKEEFTQKQVRVGTTRIKRMEESVQKLWKHSSGKGVRQRVMLQRRIEREKEKLPPLPPEAKAMHIKPTNPAWVGELPIRVINISKSFGDKVVLDNVNIAVHRNERIALLGPNGVGKSTLTRIMIGSLEPNSGEVIKDPKLKIGLYSQEFENFDLERTLYRTIEEDTHLPEQRIRPMLARFLFPQEKIFQKVKTLSGGEKTRLFMALLLLHDYNLLILDEPTTYLDPLSQRVILEVLKEYKGVMIVVSHTEEFVTGLNPNRVLIFPENIVRLWSDDLVSKVGEI